MTEALRTPPMDRALMALARARIPVLATPPAGKLRVATKWLGADMVITDKVPFMRISRVGSSGDALVERITYDTDVLCRSYDVAQETLETWNQVLLNTRSFTYQPGRAIVLDSVDVVLGMRPMGYPDDAVERFTSTHRVTVRRRA